MACDPNQLAQDAACLSCIPSGIQDAIIISLLCQIVANGSTGGGGGGGATNPPPGIVDPNGAVTGAPGATYINTATQTFWVQESAVTANTGWVQLI